MSEDISNSENSLPIDFDSLFDKEMIIFSRSKEASDLCQKKICLADERYKKGEITEQENNRLYCEAMDELEASPQFSYKVKNIDFDSLVEE